MDGVNDMTEFNIKLPDHTAQEIISQQFKKKGNTGFDCVVGCIDSMLLWIGQPTEADCNVTGVEPKKVFCSSEIFFNKYASNS